MEVRPETKQAFDTAACSYDEEFTNTPIGKLQRERVRHFIQPVLSLKPMTILEINCGTGDDATWFSKKGHKVIATDASANMIGIAEDKEQSMNSESGVVFRQSSFHELKDDYKKESFDLIFSNFGGLNCISGNEMKELAEDFAALLRPGGRLIAVVMGRKCLWEQFYFLVKGRFEDAFRRLSKSGVRAAVGNKSVYTWYHSPREFRDAFAAHFKKVKQKPVGLMIPPSYLNCFFADKKWLLKIFKVKEKFFPFSFLSDYADHYYIELVKKK